MPRSLTQEEIDTLLNNPELVMFDPYSAMKLHVVPGLFALIPPTTVLVAGACFILFFSEEANKHPTLYSVIFVVLILIAVGILPLCYMMLDDRAFKKARAEHYREQLKKLMPKELSCEVMKVDYVVVEKAEGAFIRDGESVPFGYVTYVNVFEIIPGSDLAIVSDNNSFYAFIKRDPRTESLYSIS